MVGTVDPNECQFVLQKLSINSSVTLLALVSCSLLQLWLASILLARARLHCRPFHLLMPIWLAAGFLWTEPNKALLFAKSRWEKCSSFVVDCNNSNGSHYPPPSPSWRANEMAAIPENRISTCSRASSTSTDSRVSMTIDNLVYYNCSVTLVWLLQY